MKLTRRRRTPGNLAPSVNEQQKSSAAKVNLPVTLQNANGRNVRRSRQLEYRRHGFGSVPEPVHFMVCLGSASCCRIGNRKQGKAAWCGRRRRTAGLRFVAIEPALFNIAALDQSKNEDERWDFSRESRHIRLQRPRLAIARFQARQEPLLKMKFSRRKRTVR